MKKTKKQDTKTKAIFFLRHNNDIDHITPIIYKWLKTENIPTDIIITTNRELLNDYRIEFLKQFKNARIIFINDLFKKRRTRLFFNLYARYTTEADRLIKKYTTAKKIADKNIKKFNNQILEGVQDGIVVFDWSTTYFIEQVIKASKEKGFTSISLPHGDWPYLNYLVTKDDIDYSCMDYFSSYEIFDHIVVANKSTYDRREKFTGKGKLKILGSSRYCDEWLGIHSKLLPPYKADNSTDKLKIIFFLRNECYAIFWEEVIRTIKLILQFPDVYLIVKHHPRNRIARKLTKKLLRLYPEVHKNINKNLEFMYDDVNSIPLLQWADVVIDIGTSTAFEAVKKKKPVLMLDYIHTNNSTIGQYLKSSEITCRDELYNILQKLMENKNLKFYDENQRSKFIKEIIESPGANVLDDHVTFLKKCIKIEPKT